MYTFLNCIYLFLISFSRLSITIVSFRFESWYAVLNIFVIMQNWNCKTKIPYSWEQIEMSKCYISRIKCALKQQKRDEHIAEWKSTARRSNAEHFQTISANDNQNVSLLVISNPYFNTYPIYCAPKKKLAIIGFPSRSNTFYSAVACILKYSKKD